MIYIAKHDKLIIIINSNYLLLLFKIIKLNNNKYIIDTIINKMNICHDHYNNNNQLNRPNILHVILNQMPRLQLQQLQQLQSQSSLVEKIHKKIDDNNIKMNKEQQQQNSGVTMMFVIMMVVVEVEVV